MLDLTSKQNIVEARATYSEFFFASTKQQVDQKKNCTSPNNQGHITHKRREYIQDNYNTGPGCATRNLLWCQFSAFYWYAERYKIPFGGKCPNIFILALEKKMVVARILRKHRCEILKWIKSTSIKNIFTTEINIQNYYWTRNRPT